MRSNYWPLVVPRSKDFELSLRLKFWLQPMSNYWPYESSTSKSFELNLRSRLPARLRSNYLHLYLPARSILSYFYISNRGVLSRFCGRYFDLIWGRIITFVPLILKRFEVNISISFEVELFEVFIKSGLRSILVTKYPGLFIDGLCTLLGLVASRYCHFF